MPVKHALNILISKYGIVFKMILYYAIVAIIFIAIASSILSPIFGEMYAEIKATGCTDQIKLFIQQFLDGDNSLVDTFNAISSSVSGILDVVRSNNKAVTDGIIVIIVFYVAAVFVVKLSSVACSDVINHFMNSNSRFGFASNYILNLRRSLLYSLLYIVTFLPCSFLVLGLVLLIGYGLSKAIGILIAFPIAILMFFVLYSLLLVLFSGWIPAIVVDCLPVGKALVVGFQKMHKHFGYYWMSLFLLLFLAYIFVYICTLATFGAGVLLAMPTAIVAVRVLELVLYYNVNGSKFYETEKNVTEETIH